MTLSYLEQLEAESIFILRETIAETERPVMMYSIGKDSSVLLHLAIKAFYPAPPPFPILHIDTGWKFKEMLKFRDNTAAKFGLELICHSNQQGIDEGINPFTHGSSSYTHLMKTLALKQALDSYGFDAAIGGARRDEEKSRAKERVFSFRDSHHRWDPRNQRPELWKLYNTRKKRAKASGFFLCQTGRSLMSGNIFIRKTLILYPCISQAFDRLSNGKAP